MASTGPASAQVLRAVDDLIRQGELDSADRRLRQALQESPNEPAYHNFLGVIEAQRGNYELAESSFLAAIERAPRFAGAYLNLGRLYQENSSRDAAGLQKALQTYQNLLKYFPVHIEANYQSALLLQQAGSFRESLDHLSRLPQADRQRAQALAVACADYAGLGDAKRAGELASGLLASADLSEADVVSILPTLAAAGRADLELRLLEGLTERKLHSSTLLQRLAGLYERLGRLDLARQTFEQMAAGRALSTELLLDLARVAYKQRDFNGALGYLAHARDLSPDSAGIHFFFGMVCVELNLGTEAHQALSKAVALRPDDPYYNYAMGAVSLQRRDPSEAIPYFRKYRDLKPHDPRGRLALGNAYFQSAEFESARAELDAASAEKATAAGAFYWLARLAKQEGKLTEAAEAIEKALAANPDYADAHAELGLLHLGEKRYEAAEKTLRRALDIDPDNYMANLNLLILFRRTGDARQQAQSQRFEEIKVKRAQRAQDFLRSIEVRPYEP